MLDINDQAGIRMNKSFAALVQEVGGFENLSFLKKDCRNYIDKADARSRVAYKYFGDVVTFDTMYLINRYVHARTNSKEFVNQFDNALRKKIENENEVDFHSFNATIPVVSTNYHEKVFQELYMNSKFREVQQEVMGMVSCLLVLYKNEGVISTYHVEDEVHVETFINDVTHSVYFNEAECEMKCTCGLFEMRGILYRHVFVVFRFNRICSLPEKYILDRWRKDIKRRYVVIQSSYDGVVARQEVRIHE
ncbi:protein FAR-RED ELONGATED HYPOCOTYL 3-like [Carya illinoinensis]|uniref:protein FAR-RED ELONGATED HYPOCOTYL 3-like n=1 Tax=Carya illinoinensis TaxID=32201 RepID=UPI001C729732|nr:protein FAR-RED ELONGATED HYPOCOTYL 3-like [Carya illinoinensis]